MFLVLHFSPYVEKLLVQICGSGKENEIMMLKECFSVPRLKRLIVSCRRRPSKNLWVSQTGVAGFEA
jgi:hypothetical protein